MNNYLKLEFRKNHMGMLLFLTAAFLGLNLMWLMISLQNPNESQLHWGWMMMLAQMPIIGAVLSPTFMAVIASRIADVEHKGSTFKLLYTLQSRTSLYHAKLLLGMIFAAGISIGQALVLIAVGNIVHFEGSAPVEKITLYYIMSFGVTFASYLLQLDLSLRFRNQMAPLAIGILGSFCGLFVMYLYQFRILQHIVLWTNYVTLSASVMSSYDPETRIVQYEWCPVNWYGIAAVGVWTIMLYLWGRRMAERREV
ncbi:MAG: ABC transporter permease [Lachnospiraceae bacterium]|nr:ABC transporter permease [Lachnospiraceae bacterium]